MKQCLILIFVLQGLTMVTKSQPRYPCDSIPMDLRVGAKAVIRSCQRRVTILNDKQGRLETKMVITLLNDKAEDLLLVGLPYDDLRRVSSISASALDESGKLMWSLRKYNILDMRSFNGPEKLGDARKKVFEVPSFNYPFTLEYSYTMDVKDLFLSPVVYLQPSPDISVEESGLQYIIPQDIGFNYKRLNFNTPTDSVLVKNKLYLSWKIENVPAGRQRHYAPSLIKKLPVVFATPTIFNLKGYSGSFLSWQDYGSWMGRLIDGRDALDSTYTKKVRALVDSIPQRKDKIRVLYEYLQKNTHYFYVGFGIGGNQPMSANEVAMNGYGDCKALSNYMKALLKSVGIESYYTLVGSGEGKSLQTDIPCNQFDHVILCVPDGQDTIWLECTDPKAPFNYLGGFTCDREVLAITPEGGKILRTPSYGSDVNLAVTRADIVLSASGDANIRLTIEKTGLLFNEIYRLSESKPDERQLWLSDQIGFSAFDLNAEEYEFNPKNQIPHASASFEIQLRDFAATSSSRLFVSPSFLSGLSFVTNEPFDIELDKAYQQLDSVKIEIPSDYQIEFLPETRQINTRFGSYSSRIMADKGYITFTRRITFNKASYPVETYPEFYRFITEMASADKEVVVLKSRL
jgi:hypothetical protein